MDNTPPLITEETYSAPVPVTIIPDAEIGWLRPLASSLGRAATARPVVYSLADQALAVGGIFLVNVVLARTQTREEYGKFALSYTIFTFLAGLHNAAILEPFTVYGSGRHRNRFSEYLRLMVRSNVLVGLALTGILLVAYLGLSQLAPELVSQALLGLGVTVGILLSGGFLRRAFYLQRRAKLAATSSLLYFLTVILGLWIAHRAGLLDGFSVFLVLALGWITAGAFVGRKLAFGTPRHAFLELEPNYWQEHWAYARWVLATAFVFQLTNQSYYWLLAGLLSVKEVAELKAMYVLVAPIDLVMGSLSFLVLPVLATRYAAKRSKEYFSLSHRYALAIFGITALYALGVRTLGRPLMHLLFAGKFDDLVPSLYTLALVPLLMGVGHTMNDALKAAEKPHIVFYAYLCSGSMTFLLGMPLVMRYGLRGALMGMLLSAASYTVALALGFFFCVYRKPRPPDFAVGSEIS